MMNSRGSPGRKKELKAQSSKLKADIRNPQSKTAPNSELITPKYKKRSLSLFLSNISKYLFALIAIFCFLFSPYLAQAQQTDKEKTEIMSEIQGLKRDSAEMREGVAKIEGKVEEMSKRLDDLNDGQHMLRKEMSSNFRWMVGLIMGSWITLMGTIIALFSILIKTSGG